MITTILSYLIVLLLGLISLICFFASLNVGSRGEDRMIAFLFGIAFAVGAWLVAMVGGL